VSLVVGQDLDSALLHHTDARVGGPQIDTDDCKAISSCNSRSQMVVGLTSAIVFL
jgi:hypothetical protein